MPGGPQIWTSGLPKLKKNVPLFEALLDLVWAPTIRRIGKGGAQFGQKVGPLFCAELYHFQSRGWVVQLRLAHAVEPIHATFQMSDCPNCIADCIVHNATGLTFCAKKSRPDVTKISKPIFLVEFYCFYPKKIEKKVTKKWIFL